MLNDEMLEEMGAVDWMVDCGGDALICPCGDVIELDGVCPEGCVSPLRSLGFI